MHLKIVLLFFLFLFSIVNSAENGDALAEESVIEKLHKANSVVSIAVSNALVSDPIAAATTIANYALFCGVLNLSEHLFLRCQKKEETNAFHKLVQASLYFAASKCITDIVCGPCHSAHLSMFYGSTFLILAGLNGYCKIDEAILELAQRKVDQSKIRRMGFRNDTFGWLGAVFLVYCGAERYLMASLLAQYHYVPALVTINDKVIQRKAKNGS